MPHIRIVTDSACDLPEALLTQHDITVLPHTVHLEKRGQKEPFTASSEDLIRRLRTEQGLEAAVEAPAIEEFSRLYRNLRDTCDGVLSVHVSSKLSDTVASASTAREAFSFIGQGGPFPIGIVDSLSMSMGLGWMVLTLAKAAKSGLELPKLATLGARLSGLCHVAFFTDEIDGLLKTGRAARLASQVSSLASMKPLFHLDEGQLSVYERTRTRAKARDALYNFVEDFPKIGDIAVLHTGALNDVEHLLTRIGAIYPRERIMVIHPGPAVSAWLGRDAVGVAVVEGEE